MFGILIPKKSKVSAGDFKFATITKTQASEAVSYAKGRMLDEGIIYPDAYIKRAYDCENFALAMKHYVDLYLARTYGTEGAGFPTVVIGYDKDGGGGHSVLQMIVDDIPRWFNPYPNYDTFNGLELSINEISTIKIIGMG